MKSFQQWKHRQTYFEFVGPAGQIDPQGVVPPAQMAQAPVEQPVNPVEDLNSIGPVMKRLLHTLGNKPPMQVVKAQQVFNAEVQKLLQDKSRSAARRGVFQGFNNFRQAKQNFGKQPQISV